MKKRKPLKVKAWAVVVKGKRTWAIGGTRAKCAAMIAEVRKTHVIDARIVRVEIREIKR